jgi:Dimerisation domain
VSAATPEHIMQVGMGFWASKTVLSAVELGVFSILAEARADLPTLQRMLALHQRPARDFLDALVALKLLESGDNSTRQDWWKGALVSRHVPVSDLAFTCLDFRCVLRSLNDEHYCQRIRCALGSRATVPCASRETLAKSVRIDGGSPPSASETQSLQLRNTYYADPIVYCLQQ